MGPIKPIQIEKDDQNQKRGKLDVLWNLVTFILLLSLIIVALGFVYLYVNPDSQYNPFPQPTLPAVITINTNVPAETYTEIDEILPPSTATFIPPTKTPGDIVETLTGTKFVVTSTVTPAFDSDYPFVAQSQPVGIDASVLYPDRDCNWMGVGGQVTDMQGRPYREIIVRLAGVLDGNTINLTSLAGTATKYGEAGYEFTLADHAIQSDGDLWLWLVDQESIPLSARVYFDTYKDCAKNLIIINFKQVR